MHLPQTVQAAKEGKVEVVIAWIDWLEDHPDQKHQLLNEADESGMTAAHYAAQSNDTEIMELLIGIKGGGEVEVLSLFTVSQESTFSA